MNQKTEATDQDLIRRGFSGMLINGHPEEYWGTLVASFLTFAVNVEEREGDGVPIQEVLDKFNATVMDAHGSMNPMLETIKDMQNGLSGKLKGRLDS
jgi:hypothetical protein